ncbi:BatD family protein [Thermophagus sp. OGC60D27]|uniref:BatD family protein n=1 Tax=Thermophagus sp. OGC60D27 TaxID=3458415 RepID=UPI00403811D1
MNAYLNNLNGLVLLMPRDKYNLYKENVLKSRLILLIFGILTLCSFDSSAAEVEFKVTAPNAVVQGQKFQLVYSLNSEGEDLRVPDMSPFSILMGPTMSQRSSVQIINGKVSREQEYSYTYILKAEQTGTFTIDPATIEVDGKKYQSNSITIKVVKAENQAAATQQGATSESSTGVVPSGDLFITMQANKKSVYQSQPVLITTKIYTRVNLEGISDIQHPSFRSFIAEDLTGNDNIEWTLENLNGKTYRVGTYNQKILFPQRSGTIKIEPISIEFLVRIRNTRQSTNIFDNFFDTYRTVKKTVTSKGLTINVKPLPTPQPDNFSGYVGSLNMSVSTSQNNANVNDGITLKTVLSGTGNLKVAGDPQFNIPPDFDVFDPSTSSNLSTTYLGHKGTKTYEQLIIPRHPGTYEIPPVEYVYFDPSVGKYKTLKSKPVVIKVEGSETDAPVNRSNVSGPIGTTSRESVQFLGQDIRYIKTKNGTLKPSNTFFFGTWKFYLGYLIPFLLFVLVSIIFRQKIKENANIQLKKTKRANKLAQKRLKKAASHLKSGNKEAFFEELSRGLWGYISDKLVIPVADLTRDNVKDELKSHGAQQETIDQLLEILDTCEYARYAPDDSESEKKNLYKNAVNVISRLERNVKKKIK